MTDTCTCAPGDCHGGHTINTGMPIVLDLRAKSVATTAWLSRAALPNGLPPTNAQRLTRALWAYQWAIESPESCLSTADIEAAVCEWETTR
ncbi:hypothetical protein GV792_04810 [Nocardia cyriacigeorgica]|uniref:hypothetical protein n=1 Tax=Nocardia cyriacigeorgica TaxID=135487 RepID=UPI0013B9AD61|nr:hypothetical protein [Nocardia cyriacigeorgica]NEW49364.1 hypothetical protein [Nocardia cyriacigeorgica]